MESGEDARSAGTSSASRLLGEALTAARGVEDEESRAEVLTALIPHLPIRKRGAVLVEALAAARGIENQWSRAKMLAALVPHLPIRKREALLVEAQVAARGGFPLHARSSALAVLTPHLIALTRPALARWWLGEHEGANLLRFLARSTRRDLLVDLHALSPVIAALGGNEAIVKTFRAIQDVGRWWP